MTYLQLDGLLRAESDSNVISNLRRKGWKDAPEKPSETHQWINGEWVDVPTVAPVLPITKLTLKRRLEDLGKWPAFKAFLASLGEAAVEEFALAAEIRSDDPAFQQIAPLAKQALGLTDEQYQQLLSA